jgi:polar amino acid transport system substrate-binding protein
VKKTLLGAFLSSLALLVAACGEPENTPTGASGSGPVAAATGQAGDCTKNSLKTLKPGTLTIGTDKPAYPPYFSKDDPTNGKGFESAVAYAIADKLGFTKDEVKWSVVPFNSSYAPGNKDFDFDVNQISITPARAKHVDFSSPYFVAPQAVVLAPKSTAKVSSLADLAKLKLGVQVGTTSLDAVQQEVKPSQQPQVFNDSNDVVQALKQGRVDGVVVDLPTAFYVTAVQVSGAKIAGQFQAPGGDKWGALLQKGSPLTRCVSQAVDTLRKNGTLQQIQSRELGKAAGAPELS